VRNRPKCEGTGEPLQPHVIVSLPEQFFVATGAENVDVGFGVLAITYPAAYRQVDGWRRLNDVFTLLRQLNASAPQGMQLMKPGPGQTESTLLKSVLHGLYDDATWLANSKTIEDSLRERKRDSLVYRFQIIDML
jgi:hypothetical protein